MTLLTALYDEPPTLSVAGRSLAGRDLAGAVGAVAAQVAGAVRVAVEATPTLQTVVAVAGVLAAGGTVVPLNPALGGGERAHVLSDSEPDLLLRPSDVDLGRRRALPARLEVDESPALVAYTSGSTGRPKGAVLSRRAVAFDLDALAEAWAWTADDVLVHALPLFHVHGLVLGTLGPLRVGSILRHLGTFDPGALAEGGGSLYFAVPTMWSRVVAAGGAARALSSARLLVSGSASLPVPVFERLEELTGLRAAERYGLTETLINSAARHDGNRRPSCVGPPLIGVELRLVDVDDDMGEIHVRGPNLFSGYLNRPDASADALTPDGWFATGDLGSYDDDGALRILGRKATDLIKTGGYKVGAGEIEDALLGHRAVQEAAVVGEADDDLGERIVAYVVASEQVEAAALSQHVAQSLAPHKRPREVRFVESLPRNAMGKVQKARLRG